jgi:hypothetical protein
VLHLEVSALHSLCTYLDQQRPVGWCQQLRRGDAKRLVEAVSECQVGWRKDGPGHLRLGDIQARSLDAVTTAAAAAAAAAAVVSVIAVNMQHTDSRFLVLLLA